MYSQGYMQAIVRVQKMDLDATRHLILNSVLAVQEWAKDTGLDLRKMTFDQTIDLFVNELHKEPYPVQEEAP